MTSSSRGLAARVARVSGAAGPIGQAVAAQALAPPVRANCIAPGIAPPRVGERLGERLRERQRRGFFDRRPLRRRGRPGQTAEAVAFQSSDESSFITVEILAVSDAIHPNL